MIGDDIFRYFPNDPENFLIKSGLSELIKSERYQNCIVAVLFPVQHAGVPPIPRQYWSQLFIEARNWFELDVLSGRFDKAHNTNWLAKINRAIRNIHGTKCQFNIDLAHKIKEVVVFWIIHYSLLIALVNKRFDVSL
ncbi:MAG: hypothetical protein LBI79_02565 [Nitrososphaerota archaeon]|jgi:hypothetical protein|nr:hypothetical protein [Nitrososphaerota archaeon]